MVLALQALPEMSELAAPVAMTALFFSRPMPETASATAEFDRSMIRSTPSRSNHWRAVPAAMSALFWWSAETISTRAPGLAAMNSLATRLVAEIEPGPARSWYGPDMSVSTPILMVLAWARAVAKGRAVAEPTTAAVPRSERRERRMMSQSP